MDVEVSPAKALLEKPLKLLTEEDISQLTREDCRKFLKEKGMRRPSWNKSQAIQQVLSLKALFEPGDDSGAGILRKILVSQTANPPRVTTTPIKPSSELEACGLNPFPEDEGPCHRRDNPRSAQFSGGSGQFVAEKDSYKTVSPRDNESEMIEEISRDISNKLNTTISRDFGDMVGLETHLENIRSLLHLDNEDEAMIVGICGPAGIGKTIIARASYSWFSSSFQLTCFMENLRGSYNSGLDEYAFKLGVIRERLWNQKVLIILDDVDDLKQLEAWANEIKWFGPGSRIVVTTEDPELLQNPGINDTYHVVFPSSEKALEILCKYAFGQRYPDNGFTELAKSVIDLCGNLPSRLSEVGSSLHGRKEEEWEKVICRLALSNKRKSISTGMAFLVVINLLLEIVSAVVEHLSSIGKPYLARISVVMSILSVVLSIIDLIYKIRDHKARFRCKLPIPWFYYPAPGYNRILGNFTDTVLLACAVGGFIVSTVNCSFIEKRQEGPIKASVWPLFFAIGLFGMVVYKFIQEKLAISKDNCSVEQILID